MTMRARKLIGIVATLLFLAVYCLIAMAVGANHFADASGWVKGLFYVIAGLAWLPVPMALIVWMQRS
jgi:hypothetical protein